MKEKKDKEEFMYPINGRLDEKKRASKTQQ